MTLSSSETPPASDAFDRVDSLLADARDQLDHLDEILDSVPEDPEDAKQGFARLATQLLEKYRSVSQQMRQLRRKIGRESSELQLDLDTCRANVKALTTECEWLKGQHANALSDQGKLGEQVLTLREKLAQDQVNPAVANDNQAERLELTSLRDELDRKDQRIARLESDLSKFKAYAYSRETLEVEKRSLDQERKTLLAINKQLRDDYALLTAQKKGKIFRMSDAILSDEKNKWPAEKTVLPPLENLVADIRTRIAESKKLNYSERDLRSFLAGVASGQFVILEGPPGTGKSSLPFAVADAIGGHSEAIAVQASWRDRTDLLGYYNAFDKTFAESRFLQLLVEATTPRWAGRLFFIVLDEMNLAYVEQYFADVLKALESKDRLIEVVGFEPEGAPKCLSSGRIAIPENVVFVGTANQDETTRAIAPKTYDRAHVLRLPLYPDSPLPTSDKSDNLVLSWNELSGEFDNSVNARYADVDVDNVSVRGVT